MMGFNLLLSELINRLWLLQNISTGDCGSLVAKYYINKGCDMKAPKNVKKPYPYNTIWGTALSVEQFQNP